VTVCVRLCIVSTVCPAPSPWLQVSVAGSVKVQKLMEVERYSHVMHISSTSTSEMGPYSAPLYSSVHNVSCTVLCVCMCSTSGLLTASLLHASA